MVALKVAAVRSRAARPAAGDPVAGAAACPVDPRAAAVGQFRAARRVLAVLVAEAAAFLGGRPAAAVPAAVEAVCPAWGASRFLDPRRMSAQSRYASSAPVPGLTRERVAVCDQRC